MCIYGLYLLFIIVTEDDGDRDTPMDVDKTVGDEQPSGMFYCCILVVLGLQLNAVTFGTRLMS